MNGRDDGLAHLLLALAGEDSNCESRLTVNFDVNESFSLTRPSFCMRGPVVFLYPSRFAAGDTKSPVLNAGDLRYSPSNLTGI
jgi:hypothetical protein